jgi:hypothetical protein
MTAIFMQVQWRWLSALAISHSSRIIADVKPVCRYLSWNHFRITVILPELGTLEFFAFSDKKLDGFRKARRL